MIGLDTNILVRYLAQDDPVQSLPATDIMESRVTEEDPGFVSVVAMVETRPPECSVSVRSMR